MRIADRSLPVTIVIPTRDEADRLPACLASVRWAARVIVADAGSIDATVDVALAAGATVLRTPGQTIGMQRNAALEQATTDWVLFLDADERVSARLVASIAAAIERPVADAYYIRFRNRYLGAAAKRGGWGRDRHVRFARTAFRWSTQQVHERLVTDGSVAELDGFIEHDSYRNLDHQLTKVQRYAANGANDLAGRTDRVGAAALFGRPLWRFVRLYLVDGAWRDGARGFILSVVHAWSAFAKYALLWDQLRIADEARAAKAPVPRELPQLQALATVEVGIDRPVSAVV